MDRKTPFSDEYQPSEGTEAEEPLAPDEQDQISKQLEKEYGLAKPRRRVIRASIIDHGKG